MVLSSIKKFFPKVVRDITALGGVFFTTLLLFIPLFLGNVVLFTKFIVGMFFVYVINITIRYLYFKDRPKKLKYHDFVERIYASSFPSMHSMRTWFLISVFLLETATFLLSIVLVLLGVLIAYSRIYLEKHDVIDVFFGGLFGIIIGYVITLFI